MTTSSAADPAVALGDLAEIVRDVGGAPDVDVAIDVALAGVAERFGMAHAQLLAVAEDEGDRLVVIATAGYPRGSVGVEARAEPGQGILGTAMQRVRPIRIGNLQRMLQYARAVKQGQEAVGAHVAAERPTPGLRDAQSQLAVPMLHGGRVTGVLLFESRRPSAFRDEHEAVAAVIATLLATALELERADPGADVPGLRTEVRPDLTGAPVRVRHYLEDGSTFLDDEYLVKGVPGRLLVKLLNEFACEARTEFTNREVRLDPALELPAHKDNFESRLILLRRRLDERETPFRIVRTGRGRFRLVLDRPVTLELR